MSSLHFRHMPQPEADLSDKQNDTGQIALIVLVILALVASLLMLFMDNDALMKLAVLAALWAAVLGFFLVYRYRGQAEEANAALDAQREVYEEKLERERADHRSEQLEMEQEYLDALRQHRDESIEALREQLTIVREQLEQLTGQVYYEPTTLSAAAERIREIEDGAQRYSEQRPTTSQFSAQDTVGHSSMRSSSASKHKAGDHTTEQETTVFSRVTDAPREAHTLPKSDKPEAAAASSRREEESTATQSAPFASGFTWDRSAAYERDWTLPAQTDSDVSEPEVAEPELAEPDDSTRVHTRVEQAEPLRDEENVDTRENAASSTTSVTWERPRWDSARWAAAKPTPQPEPQPHPEPRQHRRDDSPESSHHGRRRADEREGAVSVADLLKNFNK